MGHRVARIDLDSAPRGSDRRGKWQPPGLRREVIDCWSAPDSSAQARASLGSAAIAFLNSSMAFLLLSGVERAVLAPAGKIEFIGREIFRARTPCGFLFGLVDDSAAAETAPQLIGDVALHGEEVLRWPIPALRPQMRIARRIDQLRGDADLVALALHRTFEHVADVQVLADLPHIDRLAFVHVGRIVGDDIDGAIARQVGDDVFRQTVGEPARRLVAGDVGKRQHRKRRPADEAGGGMARQKSQPPKAKRRTIAAAAADRMRPPTTGDHDRDPGGFSDGFASAGGLRLRWLANLRANRP